jgi:hypothetical protein
MSVADAVPAPIRIEAGDFEQVGALVQALVAVFDAEDVALDGERLEVEVRPRGDSGAALLRALDAVEAWLSAGGHDETLVHVLDRSYRVAAPSQPARLRLL